MNISQAQFLLDKVNALHKSISIDEGSISSIERDLMLSYLRQLYEVYRQDTTVKPEPAPVKKNTPEKPVVEERVIAPVAPEPKPEPVVVAPPPPPPASAPEPVQLETPPPPAPPKPEPIVEAKPAAPVYTPPPAPAAYINAGVKAKMEQLFQVKEAKELSEKLSQRPITDLTKALAINDKLLYSNELFGRNMPAMNEALERLNRYANINDAKEYLLFLAEQYGWTNDEKLPVTDSFVKLVGRKYMG